MTRGSLLVDTAPADCWEDAFPVGNGRHGALVHGRPWVESAGTESTIVTHHHLAWPDGPAAPGPPDLAARLPRVRDLLLAGESRRALELFTGDWPRYHPRPFHPAFAILLRRGTPDPAPGDAVLGDTVPGNTMPGNTVPDGYRRTLNHRAGIAVTSWPGWRHVCFASRVRDLVVQQLSGTAPWDAIVEVDVRLPGAPAGLRITGQVIERAPRDAVIVTTAEYPEYPGHPESESASGGDADTDAGNGGYVGVTRVTAAPGSGVTAVVDGHAVRVTGCRELTLLTRVAAFRDAAGIGAARARALEAVAAVPVDSGSAGEPRLLLAEHARAHAGAFGDVALDLGLAAPDRRLPVGELLARQAARPDQPLPALLEKLFSSGRYLLLSASGLLPPRLTGLWQGDWNAAWSGAITTDANLGLQLAGAVTTEVPTAVDAVANLIREQLPDWRVNARRLFGTRGIVAPAHTDGRSGLSTHFEPRWPLHLWTAGADWLLVTVLDEALARCDPGYAAHHAGQALRELATFYEDFLTRTDSGGQVVFAPSYSPENEPADWTPAAVNATMDIGAARHALLAAADTVLAGDTVLAASTETDRDAARRWRELARRLPPYRLTPDGALAEWSWPPEGTGLPPLAGNDEHRHVSHLYPVWPLHEITVAGTPALAAGALLALRLRGAQDDSAHGYLHKALAAARLRDADLAGRLLAALTGQGFFFRSLMSSHYPNRAVYNADAACALPGVLTELLVDSVPAGDGSTCRIELLPAVPDFLPAGRLRGARTLAGVRVAELRWDIAGRTEAVLLSATDREADVSCRGATPPRRVTLPAGTPVRMVFSKRFEHPEGGGMATLADVARQAGVAASTVSYVLSGKRSISEGTRERVHRAVEALGYHPNVGARALASSRSNVLALIVPLRSDMYVPVMMEIAIGVVTQARGYGYDVLLLTNDEGSGGIRRVVSSARADAVILTDIGMEDDRIATIAETGVDAVLIGVPADPAGLDCVDLDFAAAGRLCVEHLAELGHRVVAFIGEAEGVYLRHIGFAERTLGGIRDAAADLGVDLVHRPCDGSYEAAAGALARILEERPRTTGLIVQNEGIIPPLMSLLRTSGRAVPEDVSIVALCPDQIAEQTAPRLTSVTVPAAELGTRAVDLLMRRMGGAAAGEVRLIPPSLTIRGSTAPRRN